MRLTGPRRGGETAQRVLVALHAVETVPLPLSGKS